MAEGYKTRQRALVSALLERFCDQHLTADEIVLRLAAEGNPVGKATVYRCLDRLVEQGAARKFLANEGESAGYQHQLLDCHAHYHLKCACCKALFHLECDYIDRMSAHLFESHRFRIDPTRFVLYGLCEQCTAKQEEAN